MGYQTQKLKVAIIFLTVDAFLWYLIPVCWPFAADVDGAEDFAGALYYLVKGILPMLIEFYGPVFQQAPLKYFTHDHVKVSRSICISLLV